MRKIVLLLALCFVVVGLTGCGEKKLKASTQSVVVNDADKDLVVLADCLTKNGAVMYGTSRCPHCTNQKKAFATAIDKVPYVDCDKEADKCRQAGVAGYPTWINAKGDKFPGEQSIEKLKEIGECN